MTRSWLTLAGALFCAGAACGGPSFSSEGSGGSAGSSGGGSSKGGSKSGGGGKSGSSGATSAGTTSAGGSATTGGTGPVVGGGPNPGGGPGTSGSPSTGGAPPACNGGFACPEPASPCLMAVCDDPANGCAVEPVPNGPLPDPVPGDCRYTYCEGGEEVPVDDPNDFDDGNECTDDACTSEGHSHSVRGGSLCYGNLGICDLEGVCRICNINVCPDATECMMPLCTGDGCSLFPRPRNTYCGGGLDQCNDDGVCVDCTDNGGCDESEVCNVEQQTCTDS